LIWRETEKEFRTMALAFDEAEKPYRDSQQSIRETAEHVRAYRKFTFYVTIAACCVPLAMAFVLYWTT